MTLAINDEQTLGQTRDDLMIALDGVGRMVPRDPADGPLIGEQAEVQAPFQGVPATPEPSDYPPEEPPTQHGLPNSAGPAPASPGTVAPLGQTSATLPPGLGDPTPAGQPQTVKVALRGEVKDAVTTLITHLSRQDQLLREMQVRLLNGDGHGVMRMLVDEIGLRQ